MAVENAFELAPACPRCAGKGSVAFEGTRPRPEFAAPGTAEQLARLQLWARGQETCPECDGSGQARRALAGVEGD